jgi:hypothetical protein
LFDSVPDIHGLEDHIATLTDYINSYSNAGTMKAKDDMFKKFSQHIVTRCWPRMWMRVNSWSSKGFIYCLANIPEDTIRYAFSHYQESPQQDPKRTDYGFATTFMQMVKHGLIKEILKARPSSGGKLDHLTAALAKVVKIEEKKGKGKGKGEQKGEKKLEPEEPIILYDAQTCTEFHNFLVAILIAYGKALGEFSFAMTDDLALKIKRQTAIKFWDTAIMLWKTAHSQIFLQHLTALQMAECLSIPKFSNKNIYEASFIWKEGKGKGRAKEKGKGKGKGKGKEEKGQGQREDNVDGNDEEEDVIDLVLREAEASMPDKSEAHVAGLAYRRWIRILSNHLTSLETLSKYCNRSGNQSIKISLLSADRPGDATDILDWPSVVRKLVPPSQPGATQPATDADLDIEAAIKKLQEYIWPNATEPSAGTR